MAENSQLLHTIFSKGEIDLALRICHTDGIIAGTKFLFNSSYNKTVIDDETHVMLMLTEIKPQLQELFEASKN